MWPDCDAVDVRAGRMVTVKSTIILWEQDNDSISIDSNNRKPEKDEKDEKDEDAWYSQDQIDVSEESMHSIYSS